MNDVSVEMHDEWIIYTIDSLYNTNFLHWDTHDQLWISDSVHVVRYDGETWIDCKSSVIDYLPGDIRAMTGSGNLTIAVKGRSDTDDVVGIYDVSSGQWQVLAPDKHLEGTANWGVAVDEYNRIYIPNIQGSIEVFQNGELIQHIQMPGLEPDFTTEDGRYYPAGSWNISRDALIDESGNYWLLTEDGIWKLTRDDTWEVMPTHKMESLRVFDVDLEGRIWGSVHRSRETSSPLRMRDVDGTWYAFSPQEYGLEETWIENLAIDNQNRVWIMTRSGLSIFNGAEWVVIPPSAVDVESWGGLEAGISFDQQEQPWIGTSEGKIAVFTGEIDVPAFTNITDKTPMEPIPEFSIYYPEEP